MILVTGAAGFVGRHLVRRLMQERLPVRVLITERQQRSIDRAWDVNDAYAPELVVGSILDDETAFRAVTGTHTIVHLESAMWWGRERDMERVELAGTRSLITAARAARVGRIITLSQLGAAPSSAYVLHRIKGQMEEVVRGSGLAYTIIRAGILFGEEDVFINHICMMLSANPLFFLMPGMGEISLHPLYIDDMVKVLLRSLDTIDVVDQTIEIGGAEYTSFEDLLLTVMRVTGLYRPIVSLPPYAVRLLLWLFKRVQRRTLMTPQWLDILATNRTAKIGNVYNYFGFQPRRFEDTLLTYLPEQRFFWSGMRYAIRRRPRSI